MLFEAGIKLLLFIILLSSLQVLLGVFGLVGGGVSIHDTRVVNKFHTLIPEVADEEIPLQISLVIWRETFEFVLTYIHGAKCVCFGGFHTHAWG